MKGHGLILIFALLTAALGTVAQPPDTLWSRTYGGAGSDSATTVVLTDDGGFVLAGGGSFSVLKADSAGNVEWTTLIDAELRDIVRTSDGGYAAAGSAPAGYGRVFLARLDSQGQQLWSRLYGDTLYISGADALAVTPDGGFVLTGAHFNENMWSNLFVLALDANGDTSWVRFAGGGFDDAAGHDIAVNAAGEIFVAGHINPYPSGHYMWGLRYSATGDLLGQIAHTWSDSWSRANAIVVRSDGSYLLAGRQYTPWEPQVSVYVAHVSAADVFLQGSTAGGLSDDEGFDIALTPDGGFVTAGFTGSFNGTLDMYIVKFSGAGTIEWEKNIGGPGCDVAYGVAVYPDGSLLVAGAREGASEGDRDAYVVRLAAPMSGEPPSVGVPEAFHLFAYPNPFNTVVTVELSLPAEGDVELRIMDLTGRLVAVLASGRHTAGEHSFHWDARGAASGIYFARVRAGSRHVSQKLVLLK